MAKLKAFCNYQGSKRRISKDIAKVILEHDDGQQPIYDICCGSGTISMALIDAGIDPKRITMIDAGHFGQVFDLIGRGKFSMPMMQAVLDTLPDDPATHVAHIDQRRRNYSYDPDFIAYDFLLFQASTAMGRPMTYDGRRWNYPPLRAFKLKKLRRNAYGNNYCVSPSPKIMMQRIKLACEKMRGMTAIRQRAQSVDIAPNSIVYLDPPYIDTAGYQYDLDPKYIVATLPLGCKVFISENIPLSTDSFFIKELSKTTEWLSLFRT